MDYTRLFSETLNRYPKMHFAAHSHHYWPDCTFEAQKQHWLDSSALTDEKWNHIFGNVMSETRSNIAKILNLSNPAQIVFAPNTHEFCERLLSCFVGKPKVRILTAENEFYSFKRQVKRYAELSNISVDWINVEPYESFESRLFEHIKQNDYDLIFLSQVFFTSGFHIPEIKKIVAQIKNPNTVIAIDGYHAFCAIPTDLRDVEDRIFYMAGGYKYAMSGEGVCFMHVPKNCSLRPLNTGWFAEFENLEREIPLKEVTYPQNGNRFVGSTMEPTPAYRFNAVQKMWRENGLTVAKIHGYVEELKSYFIKKLKESNFKKLKFEDLVLPFNELPPSHFVTFKTPHAKLIVETIKKGNIYVDQRESSLRFGFGLYHTKQTIDKLFETLRGLDI